MAEPDAAASRGTATHNLEGSAFDEKPKKIPHQLHRCRFVIIKEKSKVAFEKDWQKTANYGHTMMLS